MNLRDKIKNKSSELREVFVCSLGEKVYLKKLSGADRLNWVSRMPNNDDRLAIGMAGNYLIAISLRDADGNRLYEDDEVELVGIEMASEVIDELADAIAAYNCLGTEDLKAEIKN